MRYKNIIIIGVMKGRIGQQFSGILQRDTSDNNHVRVASDVQALVKKKEKKKDL